MRPTVPELLRGIADALETDAVDAIDALHARQQVVATIGILRRLAALVPHLHATLLADADDIVVTLTAHAQALDPDVRAALGDAAAALADLDVRRATLDDLDACHQRLLAVLDDAVRTTPADDVLGALVVRVLDRERSLGASIAGR